MPLVLLYDYFFFHNNCVARSKTLKYLRYDICSIIMLPSNNSCSLDFNRVNFIDFVMVEDILILYSFTVILN